jgi:hypothetical protein
MTYTGMTLELLCEALQNIDQALQTVATAAMSTANPRTINRCKIISRGLTIYRETLANTIQLIQFFEEEIYANHISHVPAPISDMLTQEERFQLDELRREQREEY